MDKLLTFEKFKKTDFYKFFNCSEQRFERMDDEQMIHYIKTGGFQEFITITLTKNIDDEIIHASLILVREWIGNSEQINPFSMDIAKSFIEVLASEGDEEKVQQLIHYLFKTKGTKDKVITLQPSEEVFDPPTEDIKKVIEVYKGELDETTFSLQLGIFYISNFKENGIELFKITWKIK